MEQDFGLAGARFSSEDTSLLDRKVFHVTSSTDEAHEAVTKIAGDHSSWSCAGQNVLDVLVEMEKERKKKEKLYWELQLPNAGNLNVFNMEDITAISGPDMLHSQHQSTNTSTFPKFHESNSETLTSQRGKQGGEIEYDSARQKRRVKKAARQSVARLATEGVQSILAPSWQGKNPRVRCQAWGCVSLSDVFLLVEVKYDVVTHLLYTEMLEEHHSPNVWESLLPWQQDKEVELLEDLAEEALEAGDMLRLAELPGAFRLYRACPDSSKECRSAVSLLNRLHTARQDERDTLSLLADRLDMENLRLLCLYIRLATLRAQRETMSYSAMVAAHQSWATWPHVESVCRAEQAALWLQCEEEEHMRYPISGSQEQAVLQWLVLTQEQERKHLISLIRGVLLEDLQGPGYTLPSQEGEDQQASMKSGCITKLRQIYTALQTNDKAQVLLQQNYPQLDSRPRLEMGVSEAGCPRNWLEDCASVLLTQLMERQDIQASALLATLMDQNASGLQALQDDYVSKFQSNHHTNLLQLLVSAVSLPSHPEIKGANSEEQSPPQSCQCDPAGTQDISAVSSEPQPPAIRKASRALNGDHNGDVADKQDICAGCGVTMAHLPDLEILCVSDATSNIDAALAVEGSSSGEEGSETTSIQNNEKQGSLVALAWSKPPQEEYWAKDSSSLDAQIQLCDISSTAEHSGVAAGESHDSNPILIHSVSSPHPDAPSADQQPYTEKEQHVLCSATSEDTAATGREVAEMDVFPAAIDPKLRESEVSSHEDQKSHSQSTVDCGHTEKTATTEQARESISAKEREKTMRSLVNMQRKVEQRQLRDRERQLLRVQERLSIIQNRKAEEDLLGLKQGERLRHLMHNLPQEDKNQQKIVVKERLEHFRRERSYIMQAKRERNTTGFMELLGPVSRHSRHLEDGTD